MLQWYNHSIDRPITTLSSYTSVLASVLTYCHKIYYKQLSSYA